MLYVFWTYSADKSIECIDIKDKERGWKMLDVKVTDVENNYGVASLILKNSNEFLIFRGNNSKDAYLFNNKEKEVAPFKNSLMLEDHFYGVYPCLFRNNKYYMMGSENNNLNIIDYSTGEATGYKKADILVQIQKEKV